MYGIPGRMPTKRRGEWFSYAPDVYQQADATEDALDLALAATFPASDALSITQPGGGSPRPRKGGLENELGQRNSPDPPRREPIR